MGNYEKAGIHDVPAFYASKFVELNPSADYYDDPLNRFDVDHGRSEWVDRRVAPGTRVLDFGCGTGSVCFLSAKDCQVFGIEYSEAAARIAKSRGYSAVFVGDLDAAHFEPQSFDYVCSQDVFGHIEFENKDHVISSLKRFLKPGGVMLHIVEAGAIDYDGMTPEEMCRFVEVDGHVSIEPREQILERFAAHFEYARGEVRFIHAKSANDVIKAAVGYGNQYPDSLVSYLSALEPREIKAFNVGAGLALESLQRFDVPSPVGAGGLMMLEASDAPLPDANHSRSREEPTRTWSAGPVDVEEDAVFARGWFAVEKGSGPYRWASDLAAVQLKVAAEVRQIRITLRVPRESLPCHIEVATNGVEDCQIVRCKRSDQSIVVPLLNQDRDLPRIVTLRMDRAFVPAWFGEGEDARRLGFCLDAIDLE